jgi:large subunit ribosomal protein L19
MDRLKSIQQNWMKSRVPKFHIGDTVDVHVRITEGDKERVQVFTGVVIARNGGGISETFTVRRIVQGEGVERVFPLHSPKVADIVVKRRGRVRRAKLYYLRDRVGKATRVAEKIGAQLNDEEVLFDEPTPPADASAESEESVEQEVEESAVAAE